MRAESTTGATPRADRAPSPYHGDAGPIRLMTPADPHPITRCYLAAGEDGLIKLSPDAKQKR